MFTPKQFMVPFHYIASTAVEPQIISTPCLPPSVIMPAIIWDIPRRESQATFSPTKLILVRQLRLTISTCV